MRLFFSKYFIAFLLIPAQLISAPLKIQKNIYALQRITHVLGAAPQVEYDHLNKNQKRKVAIPVITTGATFAKAILTGAATLFGAGYIIKKERSNAEKELRYQQSILTEEEKYHRLSEEEKIQRYEENRKKVCEQLGIEYFPPDHNLPLINSPGNIKTLPARGCGSTEPKKDKGHTGNQDPLPIRETFLGIPIEIRPKYGPICEIPVFKDKFLPHTGNTKPELAQRTEEWFINSKKRDKDKDHNRDTRKNKFYTPHENPIKLTDTRSKTPYSHPNEFVKLKNGQGWKDKDGHIWKIDPSGHGGAHWDVTDKNGDRVKEVALDGKNLSGIKNKSGKNMSTLSDRSTRIKSAIDIITIASIVAESSSQTSNANISSAKTNIENTSKKDITYEMPNQQKKDYELSKVVQSNREKASTIPSKDTNHEKMTNEKNKPAAQTASAAITQSQREEFAKNLEKLKDQGTKIIKSEASSHTEPFISRNSEFHIQSNSKAGLSLEQDILFNLPKEEFKYDFDRSFSYNSSEYSRINKRR